MPKQSNGSGSSSDFFAAFVFSGRREKRDIKPMFERSAAAHGEMPRNLFRDWIGQRNKALVLRVEQRAKYLQSQAIIEGLALVSSRRHPSLAIESRGKIPQRFLQEPISQFQ